MFCFKIYFDLETSTVKIKKVLRKKKYVKAHNYYQYISVEKHLVVTVKH